MEKSETTADQPRTDQGGDTRDKDILEKGKMVSFVDALASNDAVPQKERKATHADALMNRPREQGKVEKRAALKTATFRKNPADISSLRLFLCVISLLTGSSASTSRIQVLDDTGIEDITILFPERIESLIWIHLRNFSAFS
jgi:hypothetical protein